jgi:RNA polymerase sigma factor (sigma-70 family)
MADDTRSSGDAGSFEQVVLPHLDAAYNLARWLVRNNHDAEDIVQEAYLRAFRFFGGFHGGNARAWLLKIVRNTSYTFLETNRPVDLGVEFDEKIHTPDVAQPDAEAALLQAVESRTLRDALEQLPVQFREILILRELEGMSYKEIAAITEVPIGTVMSGLARARAQLKKSLLRAKEQEEHRGV